VRFALRRPALVAWVDLRTGVKHLLTPAAAAAGQGSHGHYLTVCGIEVFPGDAELKGDCQGCRTIPAQRSRSRTRITTPPAHQTRVRHAGIVDAVTGTEHLITDESAAEHRHAGRYLALCGTEVVAASLTAPAGGRCGSCDGAS
jgi:hypothetical protein